MSFVPCLSCQNSSTASSFVAAFLYCSILLLKRLLIRAVAHCWRCSTGFRPLWKEFCPIWRSRHVRGNMATLTLMITVSSEKAGDCRLYGLTTVDVLLGDHARQWDRVADSDNQNPLDRSPNKWQSHESYAKSGCKTHSRTLVPHKGLLCPAGGYSGVRVVKLSPNKEKSGHSNVNCTVQLLKWDSQLGCPVQCQYQAREDHGGPPRREN